MPYLLMASKWIYFVKPLLAPSFSPLRAVKIMLVMEQLKSGDIWKILTNFDRLMPGSFKALGSF